MAKPRVTGTVPWYMQLVTQRRIEAGLSRVAVCNAANNEFYPKALQDWETGRTIPNILQLQAAYRAVDINLFLDFEEIEEELTSAAEAV